MSLPVLNNPVPPVQVYNGTSSAPNLKVVYFTATTCVQSMVWLLYILRLMAHLQELTVIVHTQGQRQSL